ncbi:MAG: hypothetical protein KC425_22560, partial [Anaerolineales bacterium]|nr:hypothetical protein [Anaerolineales bacterium]
VLTVYDAEGNELGFNDDLTPDALGSGFEGVEIPFDLTLILEISTYDSGDSGTYTLRVEEGA